MGYWWGKGRSRSGIDLARVLGVGVEVGMETRCLTYSSRAIRVDRNIKLAGSSILLSALEYIDTGQRIPNLYSWSFAAAFGVGVGDGHLISVSAIVLCRTV